MIKDKVIMKEMGGMKKMIFGSCLILFLASIAGVGCATVSTRTLAPGELRLLSLRVSDTIRAGDPYLVVITFEADGEPQIKEACFYWSGEGPYCFKVRNVDLEVPKNFKIMLRTNNPGSYRLECYAEYIREGKTQKTNYIGSQIYVR